MLFNYEIGPRLSLQLIKVEDGLAKGEVIYHAIKKKTEKEKEQTKQRFFDKEQTKMKNKQIQETNVKRKLDAKEEKIRAKREKYEQKADPNNEDQSQDEGVEEEIEDKSDFEGEKGEFEDFDEFTEPVKAKKQSNLKRVKR